MIEYKQSFEVHNKKYQIYFSMISINFISTEFDQELAAKM